MEVRYVGKFNIKCEMCSKHSSQSYIYDSSVLRKMFKKAKDSFKDLTICEKCAQRESGKKRWVNIKRNKG
tara:strand:- start:122 stop:331 length:210 start_codon:yes stop_codon:yes gene_type:complete